MDAQRIPLNTDLIQPPRCPKCSAPIVSAHSWVIGGISQASWLCSNKHQTLLKWAA